MATIELTHDIELDDDQDEALAETLGCRVVELEARLELCAKAALQEYVGMLTGAVPVMTVTDVRERRLLGLITIAFEGRIPSVDRVAKHFNLPPSGARRSSERHLEAQAQARRRIGDGDEGVPGRLCAGRRRRVAGRLVESRPHLNS